MKIDVDVRRLADRLADRLQLVSLELMPLDVKCAWPVFRGTCFGRDPVFVKVTAQAAADRAKISLASFNAKMAEFDAMAQA